MPEIRNAQIKSTFLGREDHGIPTCFLYLDYGGGGQGFGGYDLQFEGKGIGFLMDVLRVVEVGSWEELPGKYVRAEADSSKVYRIGHITKEHWYEPWKE